MTSVSLVITVLNEAHSLDAWFTSVRKMTLFPDELVICDGGSTDGTDAIVESWRSQLGFPVRLINTPGVNISRGRNLAIDAAHSEWVAVTDAGTSIDENWLAELMAAAVEGVDVVSGFFYPTGDAGFERFLATMITFHVSEIDPGSFLPSSRSLLLRKDAWAKVGGYPEWLDYCEDLVFDIALRDAGYRFAFAPDALVSWSARSNLRGFAKQYYRYGRGDGKANLFFLRNLTRYLVYGGGFAVATFAMRAPWLFPVLVLGVLGYNARYFRRVFRARHHLGRLWPAWVLAVPLVGAVGDVAKMAGYPAGVTWRRRNGSRSNKPVSSVTR